MEQYWQLIILLMTSSWQLTLCSNFHIFTEQSDTCSSSRNCIMYNDCCDYSDDLDINGGSDEDLMDHSYDQEDLIRAIFGVRNQTTNTSKAEKTGNVGENDETFTSLQSKPFEERFSCVALPQYNRETNIPYMVVDWCPNDEQMCEETKTKCERKSTDRELFTDLPVQSNDTGIVYANKYCSKCHSDRNINNVQLYISLNKEIVPIELNMTSELVYHWHHNKIKATDADKFFELMGTYESLFKMIKTDVAIKEEYNYNGYLHERKVETKSTFKILFPEYNWRICSLSYMEIDNCNKYSFLYKNYVRENCFKLYVNENNIIKHIHNSYCLDESYSKDVCVSNSSSLTSPTRIEMFSSVQELITSKNL